MDVRRFLARLQNQRGYWGQIVHVEELPARPAQYAEPKEPLPGLIRAALKPFGVERLYLHQAEALDCAREGGDFVVTTGTASGKTLCYLLPILERLHREPEACALFLFPTKALAQDQLRGVARALAQMGLTEAIAGTYDGDTPPDARRRLRDAGQLILTNPDMLHAGILPHHARWGRFFERLRYVVLDEIHTYRGVFGSHVACVLRRLERICRHYDARPQYLCSSATIANPAELAEQLAGRRMALIDRDGSPRGPKWFVLWNPPLMDEEGVERRSAIAEAEQLMTELIRDDVPTIAFVRTRMMTEVLYRLVREALSRRSTARARRIRAYRGGYLPEERRQIERQLFEGELLGVTTTNALELGIDIGSLEACLIVGYPGTIASTWQQAGRAGRGEEPSLVVLIGRNAPVDQYLMQHGEYLFERNPEHAIVDPTNPHIAIGHLRCAAHELPITREEATDLFGEFAPAILELLSEEHHLRRIGERWHYARSGYPAADISLRNVDDRTYTIVERTDEGPRTIGALDEIGAFMQAHTGAIYLHDGETYLVERLDVGDRIAYVRRKDVDYYTQALTEPDIRLDEEERRERWRTSDVGFGEVTVSLTVTMFKKVKIGGREVIGWENLDLPTRTLETVAFWVVPSASSLARCREWGRVPTEGLQGIANVLVEVIPFFVMGDPGDIGAVVDSGNLGRPTLFVYDRYPGGIGYAEKAFGWVEQIMSAALEVISRCSCHSGCPSCVGAPPPQPTGVSAYGEGGRVPDKDAALILLHDMLGLEPYQPSERRPPLGEQVHDGSSAPMPPSKPLPPEVERRLRDRMRRRRRDREGGNPSYA